MAKRATFDDLHHAGFGMGPTTAVNAAKRATAHVEAILARGSASREEVREAHRTARAAWVSAAERVGAGGGSTGGHMKRAEAHRLHALAITNQLRAEQGQAPVETRVRAPAPVVARVLPPVAPVIPVVAPLHPHPAPTGETHAQARDRHHAAAEAARVEAAHLFQTRSFADPAVRARIGELNRAEVEHQRAGQAAHAAHEKEQHALQRGKKGGAFYLSPAGHKVYVGHK
jgi:hypothetical protein